MSSGWRVAATAPLLVRPEPSPVRSLYPRHLRDRLLPDTGTSSPEGTEAPAGSLAPQTPSGQCASAWRGRVGPGRCCALGLLRSVSVYSLRTLAGNRAPTASPGDRTREKKRSGRGRPPWPPPPRRSRRTRGQPSFAPALINYAARSPLLARPDVLCNPGAASSPAPTLSTCPGWGGS